MMAPAATTAKNVFISSFSVTGSSGFATLFWWIYRPKTGPDLEMSARIIHARQQRAGSGRARGFQNTVLQRLGRFLFFVVLAAVVAPFW